jgi:thiamine kinase-like enzyme
MPLPVEVETSRGLLRSRSVVVDHERSRGVAFEVVEGLDPALAAAIAAVPAWAGLEPQVSPITLGITNRNFRVDIGGTSFVVRLSGRDTELLGIDRAAEHLAARAAAAAGVAPEVFAYLPEHGALITRFVEADLLSEEDLERPETIGRVVSSVRAIHGMAPIASTFDPFRVVREYRRTAEERGVRIPPEYDRALERADEVRQVFRAAPMPTVPCHNDLLNANFLVRDGRVLIVDYEYAGMGDPFFDLGNLSVNNGLSPDAQVVLLEAYFGRVTRAGAARLALMGFVSDFREAMWGVVQQALSTLDVDYVGYADRHFARCLENGDGPAFERWLFDAGGEL